MGHYFPMVEMGKDFWVYATLAYCFVAAVLPVGLLLPATGLSECRISVRYSWDLDLVGMLVADETDSNA